MLCFKLLGCGVELKKTWVNLKPALDDVIFKVILPICYYSDDDAELWETDPHEYVRRHLPKFWETLGRVFRRPGIHNALQHLVLTRVKHLLGYPGAQAHLVHPPSLLVGLGGGGEYGTTDNGAARPAAAAAVADARARAYAYRSLAGYMAMADLDTGTKRPGNPRWCKSGVAPPGWRPAVAREAARTSATCV